MASNIVFVCLHGSAKSLIAAEYLTRRARERGVDAVGISRGTEPDAEVPAHVVQHMATKGFDLSSYVPKAATATALEDADQVITFGPDVSALVPGGKAATSWAECPAVSDGFPPAWDFITHSVDGLLDHMPVAK